jgi:hypothetical protein
MNGQSWRRWVRLAVGGLWTLALGTAFAPAEARAGCGDGLVLLHAAGPPRTTRPDRPQPAPLPCSGPSCSRIPLAPPLAPATPPVLRVDETGALAPPPLLAPPSLLDRPIDGVSSRPVRQTADVYHPPR